MASDSSTISEMIMKALLFLGIFAVAADGGKNEYKFEVGINLTAVLFLAIFLVAAVRTIEIKSSMSPVINEKSTD